MENLDSNTINALVGLNWVIVLLLVIYIGNTIWFVKLRNESKQLSNKIDEELKDFHLAIKDYEESVLHDMNTDATSYFKSVYTEYDKFSETNPRYLFNLINIRNYVFKVVVDADKVDAEAIDIFGILDAFAISWAKNQKDVFEDYVIICRQYKDDKIRQYPEMGEALAKFNESREQFKDTIINDQNKIEEIGEPK